MNRIFFLLVFLAAAASVNSKSIIGALEIQTLSSDSIEVNNLIKSAESDGVRKDSAYSYIIAALRLSKKVQYTSGIAQCYRSLIAFAKSENEIDSLMNLSVKYFDMVGKTEERSLVYLRTASRYLSLGHNFINAFQHTNRFLDLENENTTLPQNLARGWTIIGEVYRISKNYDKAMDAYRRAKKYSVDKGKIKYLAPFINIGTIYYERGYLDSALNQYNFIQDYIKNNDNVVSSGFAYIHYRKSQVLLAQGDLKNAMKEANSGYELYSSLAHTEGKVLTLGAKTEILYKQKSYKKAIIIGKEAIELASSIDYIINDVEKVCEAVSESYLQLNDYKNGYHYLAIQNQIRDNLYSPSIITAIIDKALQEEVKKRKLQHRLAEEEKTKDESIILLQKTLISFSSIGLLLVIIGCILLYRNAKAKTRLNIELQEKQNEISSQNEELISQAEELTSQAEELTTINEKMEEVNKNLETIVNERTLVIKDQNQRLREYAYFNAHKVRGPLARILGLIAIIEYEFPGESLRPYREMLKAASMEMDHTIAEIRDILDV